MLDEGVSFLKKYQNKKTGFNKAVKEMVASLDVMQTRGQRKKVDEELEKVLEKYKNHVLELTSN